MVLGAMITAFLFLARIPVVRLSVSRNTSPKDAAYMAGMIPKGLGAAVLASLPAQQGVEGGEIIQSVVFSIILCSTVLTTTLTFLLERTFFARFYSWIFRLLGLGRNGGDTEPNAAETPEVAEAEMPETPKPKRRKKQA